MEPFLRLNGFPSPVGIEAAGSAGHLLTHWATWALYNTNDEDNNNNYYYYMY